MSEPSALRTFLIEYMCLGKKFLIYNLVNRNLKIKYRRSFLGVVWTVLSPVSMAVVYYYVFKVILRVQMPHYLAFILCGTLPWAFFAQSLMEGMESLVANQGLLSKVPVPVPVFPYVCILTNMITLLIATPIIFIAAWISGVELSASVILLPVLLGCLFLITYAFTFILAHLYVFFRDLKHLMSLVIQIWFYGTPVIYDEQMIPEKYHWVLYINPFGTLFSSLHDIFVRGIWPNQQNLMVLFGWTCATTVLARVFQVSFSREIVENL